MHTGLPPPIAAARGALRGALSGGLCGLLLATCAPSREAADPSGPVEAALRRVAASVDVDPERLSVLAASPPGAGEGGGVVKVVDRLSGRIWRWGQPLPDDPRWGFCGEEGVVSSPGVSGELWALIRLVVDPPEPWDPERMRGLAPEEVRILLGERRQALSAQAAARYREVFPDSPRREDEFFGPFVVDQLPPEMIVSLCADDRLSFIGPYRRPQVLDAELSWLPQPITDSLPTTRTERVQREGLLAESVRVAVLEDGGLFFDRACFSLAGIQKPDARPDEHISKALAMIGSSLPVNSRACAGAEPVGYAPAAQLLMANAETTDENDAVISHWLKAAKWAIKQKADVISMSFHPRDEETDGRLGSRDVFFDWVAVHQRTTVLTSAGNQGALQRSAYASGKGYNFLGVGNVVNSEGAERCKKVISPDSSWRNPKTPHRDRELPEVAMPGSSYRVGGIPFGRTSAATPAAAGVAALLIDAEPELRWEPQAVRALLLATADFQLSDRWMWAPTATCDGRDGTGLINTEQAVLAARSRGNGPSSHGHDHGLLLGRKFSPGDPGPGAAVASGEVREAQTFERTWRVQAAKGETIRAAFTWNSDVYSRKGPSVLAVDLDLSLAGACDGCTAIGATYDNNYELVTLTAPETGVYELRVFGFDVPRDLHTGFGIAWMTSRDDCLRAAALCDSPPGGGR